MADLVSPIVDIISRLWPCCAKHTRYLCKLQENKILLRNAMDELKDVRNDVQRRVDESEADPNEPKKRTDSVSGWLQRVVTIEGEVEVILQKADEQLLSRGRCLGGCCCPPPSNKCWSNYKLGKSIANKIPLVDELKGKGHFQEVTYRLPPSSVEDMNLESTVGMESMFDKVWRLINSTNDDDKLVGNIIGLYGQGGVGKTTLLEKINNEFHNKISTGEHGFDYVVIFVVVSQPVNYEAIQKKIGERLGLSLQGDGDEKSRAQKIFNALRNKNYVLLLDDIWEDQFDKKRIGIPIHPPPQGNSSKLIFTSRSERVCGLMEATHTFQVECLPWDNAWSLFKDKVGVKALNYLSGGALELAKDVAKECGGLPLALITIGRAMSTKKSVQEWRDAIATLRRYASEFKDMRDKVLASLKLSYDNLPDETEKSCFRYCALFPEDYRIEIAKLVQLWIGEGFLDGIDKLDEARNRGHTIIGSLKSACLLESSGGEDHVKMHDVIRDLALWIVNDCRNTSDNKFLVAAGGDDPHNNKKWENAERIFWDATHYATSSSSSSSSSNVEENPPTSPNLLTLIIRNGDRGVFRLPQRFFQRMPLLRVLDFTDRSYISKSTRDEFPMSLCELHELQYLNISGMFIKELPVELRKLVKLKFLVLRNTPKLKRIPAGVIANLSEIQVLDLCCDQASLGVDNWELEDGPSFSEVDGLKQLQEVRITIKTYVALENFLCNQKLQMVCTDLIFKKSYKSVTSSSRRVLDLSNFKSLKYLVLISGFSELEELVLYGRYNTTDHDGELPSNLETLLLHRFPKLNSIQPNLLPSSHFQSLHYIQIYQCYALKDLTWLAYVQNLKTLNVEWCTELETIIELGDDQMLNTGGGGGGGVVFGRLETLVMKNLPNLKSICRHALALPSIKTIQVYGCLELKKLPLDSRSNINNTLEKIGGQKKWWNELQWEDETVKSKFLPYYQERYY